jgi:PAS domain S-box-containing protein
MKDRSASNVDLEQQLEELKRDLVEAGDRLATALAANAAEASHRHRLAAIVEASRDAIWSWNVEGIIESWNAEAERLFQYRADEIIGRSLLILIPQDRMDRARAAIENFLQGQWYERYETVRVRKDGIHVPVELTVSPIKKADGAVVGIATTCRDISTRLAHEQALRTNEARYRAAVITGRIGAWETDMVQCTRFWTEEGMALFGLNLPDGKGQVSGPNDEFRNSLHPDDRHLMEQFHRTADQEDSYPCEYRIIRPDGTMLWVSGRGRVIARASDGKAQRVANIVMDITDRKKAEEHVQLLMREITHRSKNLLAVVQAIAGQTAASAGTLEEFQDRFIQRLRGLAASHDLLVEADWRGARLHDLIRQQLAPFAEIGARLQLDGPSVTLTATAAQTIGMALHELATNATKYGAWSVASGRVVIAWAIEPEATAMHLDWIETGGPLVIAPARKGFGHIVLENIVTQSVHGEVHIKYEPAGLQWHLSLPTENLTDTPGTAIQ